MVTIHLHKLEFFSFHGLYEIEKKEGNNFEVNIDISFIPGNIIQSINDTINYVSIYEIVSERMQIATELLETLAQDIAETIHQFDIRIKSIKITISKINPPIAHFKGTVGVSIEQKY